jgi:hypothetical protein
MDALPYVDTLVKEYLAFRGFTRALASFNAELVRLAPPSAVVGKQHPGVRAGPALSRRLLPGMAAAGCDAPKRRCKPAIDPVFPTHMLLQHPTNTPILRLRLLRLSPGPASPPQHRVPQASDSGCGLQAEALVGLVFGQLLPSLDTAGLIDLLDFLQTT